MTITVDTLWKAQEYNKLYGETISLRSRVNRLQKQNVELYRKLRESSLAGRHLDMAYDDACQMIIFSIAGLSTSRESMFRHGIQRRRWNRAYRLCKIARIVHGHRIDPNGQNKLDMAYQDLKNHPKAFKRPVPH